MKSICLVKLGGSLITDKTKPYMADVSIMQRLARELKIANMPLVIVHGSGSFGHTSATLYGGKKGYKDVWGIAKVAHDVMELNTILMSTFIREKLPAVSLRPMSMCLSEGGKITKHTGEIVTEILARHLIPVLHGDVIWDKKWKSTIYSAEMVLGTLALYLQRKGFSIRTIVQVGRTNGVYDGQRKTIPVITPQNWPMVKAYINGSDQADVTGGMRHKVEQALALTEYNVATWVLNGVIPNQLAAILQGKRVKGTLITKEL